MSHILALADAKPVAQGSARSIYRHPHNTAWLIKILRPDLSPARRRRVIASLHRELRAYVDVHLAEPGALEFINPIVGLTKTDLGLGLVVSAVLDENEQLAPTLAGLLRSGAFTPEHNAALERTLEAILASSVVAADLNAHNFVCLRNPDGSPRFVLVDGLGDKTLIPFNSFCPALNRHNKRDRIARLRRLVANGGRR